MNTLSLSALVVDLARNVSMLVALTFTYSLFQPSLQRFPARLQPILKGLCFGLFSLGMMLDPIPILPNVFLDGRSMLLGVAGAFGGWKSASIAAVIVIAFRLLIGGAGVAPSIGAVLTSAVLGTLFYWRGGGLISSYKGFHLLLLGLLISIQRSLWMLILPAETAWAAFQITFSLTVFLFPLGTFLIGTLLIREQQRMEGEAALKESESRYRRLTEGAEDIIYRYRIAPERGFEYINRATTAISGYTPEEHYADPDLAFNLIHPEDRALLEQTLQGYPAGETLILRWMRKDGQMIWTEQRNILRVDETGKPIAIEGIARDISARKQAEEALKASEEQYRGLFDQIEDAIFIHDAESNILDVNQATCDRLGYSREELLRMKTIDIDAPEYGSKFGERLAHQLGSGKLLDIDGVHVTRDGRLFPVHVNSRAITYKGQQAVLAVARDVTELRRAEQQSIELKAERARVKVLTDFVRDISHDFRTPLATIGTNAYLLLRTSELDKRKHYYEGISLQVKWMAHQIERLLLVVRLDAEVTFEFDEIHVGAFLEALCDQFAAAAQAKGVRMMIQMPEGDPTIRADSREITQAIGELIDNAIAFTHSGGAVTLWADVEEDTVVIMVEDTGEGISPAHLPHIFDQFYRADAARAAGRGASGLGLSIAEKIVKGHQGSIEVESREGEGSKFRVVLPKSSEL